MIAMKLATKQYQKTPAANQSELHVRILLAEHSPVYLERGLSAQEKLRRMSVFGRSTVNHTAHQ